MSNSIVRKALAIALAVALPPVVLLSSYPGAGFWLGLSTAVPGIALAVWSARGYARRIRNATGFVEELLKAGAARAAPSGGDDELGRLAWALTGIGPRIDDLLGRLRNELTRREAILASMTDGVVAVDGRLNVTFCNHAFARAVGEAEIIEGGPLIRSVRDPELIQILKEVIETGEPVQRRIRLSIASSPSFEAYAAPLSQANARGALAILHDVTPDERLERMRRDFVANVSHEFRTPLATIRGFAETLLEGGLEDEAHRRKFVETILANANRLNNIAADLLALADLEEGRRPAEPETIPVAEAIQGAARAVEPAAELAGVRIRCEDLPEVYVRGHRIRLEQALVNLVDNAVKFNRPNGEVRVEVARRGDQVEIAVSDTGIGIPAQDLGRIFERFYRVDKARSRQVGGTGLGLSIVKHAIQQMNGTVTVESDPENGSTFRITMPSCPAPPRVS